MAAKLRRIAYLEKFKERLYERYRYTRDADIWLCIFTGLEYMVNVANRLEYRQLYNRVARTLADSFFVIAAFDNIRELKCIESCSSEESAKRALEAYYKRHEKELVSKYYDENIVSSLIRECMKSMIPPIRPYSFEHILEILKQMRTLSSAILKYAGQEDSTLMKKVYFVFALTLHKNPHEDIAKWMLQYGEVNNGVFVDVCYDLEHATAPWIDVACPRIPELRTLLNLRREGNLRELLRYAACKIREILLGRDRYLDTLERIYFKVIPEVRKEIGVLGI